MVLEARYWRRLQADEPILAWLARRAAHVVNRGLIGACGRTPEKRRVGKRSTTSSVLCGETCLLQAHNRGKPTARWRDAPAEGHLRWSQRKNGRIADADACWPGERNRHQQFTVGRMTRSRVLEHLQRLTVGRQASAKTSSWSS